MPKLLALDFSPALPLRQRPRTEPLMPVHGVTTTAKALVEKLKARSERAVYQSQDGDFWIDHQGGPVTQDAIREAFKAGHIKLKWPDRPDLHHYVLK